MAVVPEALNSARSLTIDLDGTLVDTVLDLHQACNAMLAELQLPDRSVEEIGRFIGRGTNTLVRRCLTDDVTGTAPSEALFEQGLAAYLRHYTRVNGSHAKVYPGVKEGLAALQAAGYPMAVVTNKPVKFTLSLLEATGLAPYFQAVIGGDSTPNKKPAPDPIILACTEMSVSLAHNIHVGDSGNDIQAAGYAAVGMTYGYAEGYPIKSEDCDALVAGLDELARMLPGRAH
ncbi:MAG: Phosphoglycolate phosphatase [Fluviibacter phosphoraccumulans EoVTN8]